jgi:oligoendopeptidase F
LEQVLRKCFSKERRNYLGIYSHIFFTPLYLADYPIGHLVSFQIEEKIRNMENLGAELNG